ncbi:hypothetical protein ACE1N8_30260 [Streptomyces sp. DSM 116494]|uniref:hypothetical protein n=1 Tax=Streptomyces okerensis TaxID=3344655 RepID=UPI003890DFD1
MRRTARALSLAAVAGTVLGALAPAAFAGTVPGSGPSWGTATHSPCPEPGGHGWEGYASRSAQPGAAEGQTSELEAVEPEIPGEEALDEALGEEQLLEEPEAMVPDALPEGAEIPPPADTDAAAPQAMEPGTMDLRTTGPRTTGPTPPKPEPVKPEPVKPEPTASGSTHCAPTPTAGPAHEGVHAGAGGAFTDSVPALAAGGLLIAGAFGAAAHRLYRDRAGRGDA